MYDVIIVGAGVSGCAIARELSRHDCSVCVVERDEDVCCGTSKANSAIVHAGFDAEPGSLMAQLNVEGNRLMYEWARELDVRCDQCGSLVVCVSEDDREGLEVLRRRGEANGVPDLRIIEREEPKTIKLEGEGTPVPLTLWIQLLPLDAMSCKMRLTLRAELNFFIRQMVSKPLQDGVENIANMLAGLPYADMA